MTEANEMSGRVALVTGASRGIGNAIAMHLARSGHLVVGTATTKSGAEKIADELKGFHGTGKILDVTDRDAVFSRIAEITSEVGAPQILINNAGVTRDNLLLRMKNDDWDHVISTNLNSLFSVCKACIRGMTRARWGRIVNISSVVGSMGNPGQSNYAATKAGMEGMARALARELGARSITVNCVAPGFIDTDMTRGLTDTQRRVLLSQVPLGRFGNTNEVAEVVAFLASDAAAYISGETLHVNGGMYMR